MDVSDFKDYIISQFKPSCMVFSSPGAKKIFNENNLSPAEFLRPFGDMKNELFVLTVSEKNSVYIKNFQLDFFDSTDYEKIPMSSQLKSRHKIIEMNSPHFTFSTVY